MEGNNDYQYGITEKVVQEIKKYLIKDKIRLGLEKITWFCEEFNHISEIKEIEDVMIIQLRRLKSIEKRLIRGLIKYEEVMYIENMISNEILILCDKILKVTPLLSVNSNPSIQQNSELEKLIGTWYTDYYDEIFESGVRVREIWTVFPDNTAAYYFYKRESMQYIGEISISKWQYSKSILIDFDSEGFKAETIIEWLGEDAIISTILTSDPETFKLNGMKKIYRKCNG